MKHFLKVGCKSTFVVLLIVALSSVAMAQKGKGSTSPNAQQDNLYEAMKAQNVPSTIRAEDLTADWHIIQVNPFGVVGFGNVNSDGFMNQIYFTHGDAFTFSEQKYLVAYHIQFSSDAGERKVQNDALDSFERSRSYRQPTINNPVLYKNTTLALSLLPINQSQSFHEIEAFDPKMDIAELPPKAEMDEAASQAKLKKIALATLMYTQDYDDKFPPMIAAKNADAMVNPVPHGNASVDTVQNRLVPYTKGTNAFIQPVTKRPYLPNYKISRQFKRQIKNPSQVFMFYEDAPDAAGMRNVAYVDGHVKTITEVEFQRERKAQGISESGYPSAMKATPKAK